MNLSRYILKYSTDDGTLYFNTKTNHSFFLTNELNRVVDSNDVIRKEFHAYLDKNKYLSEGEYEVEKYLSKISDTDAELLELTILTHGDCNFRCKYCYEKFENIAMSTETEDAIVQFLKEKLQSGKYKYLSVGWFGGEPLLGYKTIKRLSPVFIDLCEKYQIHYQSAITTNGYLLTKNKFRYLNEKFKVTSYQITLDGDEESHNNQRVLQNGGLSYNRIFDNLKAMQESKFDFICVIRFNVSKDNYQNVKEFLTHDGIYFKDDSRFKISYHNIGNWGKGDRDINYCVTLLDKDASFELSKLAVTSGYYISSPEVVVNNNYTCYSNRKNHFMFNVRGIVQSCTVALYEPQNIFGNINKGFVNYSKLNDWVIRLDASCKECPFVLICKSGYCPMDKRITKTNSRYLCKSMKEKIRKNLALFALSKSYNDILDVD